VTPAAGGQNRAAQPDLLRGWLAVTGEVAADGVSRLVFALVAAAVGFGYSVLLPFDYTQRISFANWHYLDARYLFYSTAFGLGMAWVLTLQIHAVRRISRNAGSASPRNGGSVGAVAAFVSLLPSFLCCSPAVPTVVSLLGLSAATRLHTTGRIQHFFATQQNWLLLGALALLVASGVWSTRKLTRARCLTDQCTHTEAPPRDTSTPAPADRETDRASFLASTRSEAAQRR
jgi:hypothetical protein